MKEKFSIVFVKGKDKRSFSHDYVSNTPSFWSQQAKLDSKSKIDTSYNVITKNGKQVVSSVRSKFPNGNVMIMTNLGNCQKSNKTVSRSKAPSHKKNSISSYGRKNRKF